MNYENGTTSNSFIPGHSWAFKNRMIFCEPGFAGCFSPILLSAKPSSFHDEHLAEATEAINSILAKIPEDEEGRSPAFLSTRWGIVLAWVVHDPEADSVINVFSEDQAVADALNLDLP